MNTMTGLVASGDPLTDPRGFRQCLGQFSTGVTVITAEHEGLRAGVTANSFSSLSLDPPLILWSINRTSRALAVFAAADHFAVNILAEHQIAVSQRFASKEDDKFATVDWYAGSNGAPLVRGAAARLECTVAERHDAGDHVLLIGRVTRFEREDRKGLIFSQGRYSIGVDHPATRQGAAGADSDPLQSPGSLGNLVFKAHLKSSRSFDAERASLGLSIGQARLLFVLSEHPALSRDDVVLRSNLPWQTVEDALSDLMAHGAVARSSDGAYSLTDSGKALRIAVNQKSQSREAELVAGIDPAHLTIAKQVLSQFLSVAERA